MQKAQLEIVGTRLDTVSFLLVTTSLYGEKRLKELGALLSKLFKFDQIFGALWVARSLSRTGF
jgi:hypothetical protein